MLKTKSFPELDLGVMVVLSCLQHVAHAITPFSHHGRIGLDHVSMVLYRVATVRKLWLNSAMGIRTPEPKAEFGARCESGCAMSHPTSLAQMLGETLQTTSNYNLYNTIDKFARLS